MKARGFDKSKVLVAAAGLTPARISLRHDTGRQTRPASSGLKRSTLCPRRASGLHTSPQFCDLTRLTHSDAKTPQPDQSFPVSAGGGNIGLACVLQRSAVPSWIAARALGGKQVRRRERSPDARGDEAREPDGTSVTRELVREKLDQMGPRAFSLWTG